MWQYLPKSCNCNTTPTNPGVVCDHDKLKANDLVYRGEDVECAGVYNGMTVADVLQQIDYYICGLELTQTVLNIIEENPQEFNDFITLVNGAINCETISNCGNPPTTTTTTTLEPTTTTTTTLEPTTTTTTTLIPTTTTTTTVLLLQCELEGGNANIILNCELNEGVSNVIM